MQATSDEAAWRGERLHVYVCAAGWLLLDARCKIVDEVCVCVWNAAALTACSYSQGQFPFSGSNTPRKTLFQLGKNVSADMISRYDSSKSLLAVMAGQGIRFFRRLIRFKIECTNVEDIVGTKNNHGTMCALTRYSRSVRRFFSLTNKIRKLGHVRINVEPFCLIYSCVGTI